MFFKNALNQIWVGPSEAFNIKSFISKYTGSNNGDQRTWPRLNNKLLLKCSIIDS